MTDWMAYAAACWGFPLWTQADEGAEAARDHLDADEVSPAACRSAGDPS